MVAKRWYIEAGSFSLISDTTELKEVIFYLNQPVRTNESDLLTLSNKREETCVRTFGSNASLVLSTQRFMSLRR